MQLLMVPSEESDRKVSSWFAWWLEYDEERSVEQLKTDFANQFDGAEPDIRDDHTQLSVMHHQQEGCTFYKIEDGIVAAEAVEQVKQL